MREKIVAGNWKMNKTLQEAESLFKELENRSIPQNVKVIAAPPSCYLAKLAAIQSHIHLSSQNCHYESSGAFTGELSPVMLKSMDVNYCIIGHSERRAYFKEDDSFLAKKVKACIVAGITPIFCCGEVLEDRKSGNQEKVVGDQVKNALFDLSPEEFASVIIAYEPVWAIGTGETASPEQAQDMHRFIRKMISDKFGNTAADDLSILYGGSCKPSNASELFSQPDVDGGLIGGASLNADDFLKIIEARA